jgi:hypothetical protein
VCALLQRHENGEEWSGETMSNQVSCRAGQGVTDPCEQIHEAIGSDSASRAQIFRWHEHFERAREGGTGTERCTPRLWQIKHKRRFCNDVSQFQL